MMIEKAVNYKWICFLNRKSFLVAIIYKFQGSPLVQVHLAKPQLKHLSKETIYSVAVLCLSWAALLIPYCHTLFFFFKGSTKQQH